MALKNKTIKVGINEIAEALNISKSTVSRALNNHPKISNATKQKVLKQSKQLGYKPSIPDLISNKESKSIALILPHTNNVYFSEIVNSAKEVSKERSFSVFICESNYDIDVEKNYIEQIKALGFKALIYVSHKEPKDLDVLNYLIKEEFPVSIIHEASIGSPVSTVMLDVHKSFNDSITHLKSNGAELISYFMSEQRSYISNQIASLFGDMLESEGLKFYPELVIKKSADEIDLASELDDLFNGELKPDALIFDSYTQAFKAYQYINENPSVFGTEILIMSVHSNDLMLNAKPNITYFQLQGMKMGKEAADLVYRQIEGESKIETKLISSRLIIKSSSLKV